MTILTSQYGWRLYATRCRLHKPLLCALTQHLSELECCATCMINLLAIFSGIKRLLAISSTSRQDHDTTLPIISPPSSGQIPNLRYSNMYRNGIPPPSHALAHGPQPLYPGFHITSHHVLGHLDSVRDSHSPPPSHTHFRAPASPPSPPLQIQHHSPSGSDNSINMPPPAYFSGDRPPRYLHDDNSIGPMEHTAGAQSGGLFDMASLRRSRISRSLSLVVFLCS